ncbi:hypothetical protein [Gluconacetobacter johannae]|uniref:Uncharacterized protein n=1 Tax=Gluconacetobacter johannae TaxID=112140 RepID=A0A7W4J9V3_9PROT|nr:hypothetical protein [Gluconacetobacter johannae]MBB2177291.1 hypothetical protein [Gluconacetobacter johannae]
MNSNIASGLRPLSYMSGAPYSGGVQVYYVPAGNPTPLFIGDPLVALDGVADANGVPGVGIATAGGSGVITGVMQGVANNAGELVLPVVQNQAPYLPAGQAAYVYVADDPNLVFAVQEDSVGGALAAGAVSKNADLVAGAGSTVNGFSGWQLQSASVGTTATLQVRILRAYQSIDNAVGANAKWLVRINLHSITSPTGI